MEETRSARRPAGDRDGSDPAWGLATAGRGRPMPIQARGAPVKDVSRAGWARWRVPPGPRARTL